MRPNKSNVSSKEKEKKIQSILKPTNESYGLFPHDNLICKMNQAIGSI